MTTLPSNPHGVAVGQVWADNDPRCAGRLLTVTDVGTTHATVTVTQQHAPDAPARTSRVRLDRFRPTSTGYRLVNGPS